MSISVDAQAHLKAMFNQNLFTKMHDFKGGLFFVLPSTSLMYNLPVYRSSDGFGNTV